MHEIERKTGDHGTIARRPKYDLEPMSWRDVKQAGRQRYGLEVRVETGKRLAIRSNEAIDEIRAEMGEPDQLKNLILQSFGFGAAELINDYMAER